MEFDKILISLSNQLKNHQLFKLRTFITFDPD